MKLQRQLKQVPAAKRLLQDRERILEAWEKAVRAEIPAAQAQRTPALRDSLPEVLNQMIRTLEVSNSSEQPLVDIEKYIAKKHGEVRAEALEYTLDQMIWEYHLLRCTLFNILEEREPITKEERDVIWDALFIAIRNSATRFSQVRSDFKDRIHHRRQMEAEKLHELLVESVEDYAIFTLDAKGLITTWNPGCVKMKQYTSEEVIGQHFEMLYPPEGRLRNEPRDHLKSALIEGRFRGEGLRRKKDGSRFFCNATITPIYWEGLHIGFGKVVENLDERNRLIQERDVSKTEANELKLEKDLSERFVHALTHDLRTPLTASKMSAQLINRNLRNLPAHSKVRSLALRISESMDRMDQMIKELLDVGRIKAGERLSADIQKADMYEIVTQVQKELSGIYGKRFKIECTDPFMGFWYADGIRRILENLMANAAKYGQPGTEVTVAIRKVETRCLLTVHNFGPPIPLEEQLMLFDRFRRSKVAETSRKKGWGLGLTLVKGLAEANGGSVKVESYPKEGTRFTVDLPMDARSQV